MKKNGTRVLSNHGPLPVYGFGHCRSVEEQRLHFLKMYGPPPDCRGKVDQREDGLRKCIRPFSGGLVPWP